MSRRFFTRALALSTALASCAVFAQAQNYPNKPVHIIVGQTGGVTDATSRLLANDLSTRLGQQFLVENRTGGNNSIAARAVMNSPPDGYTLYGGAATPFSRLNMAENSIDASKEMTPVSIIALGESFIIVRAELGVNNLKEFAAKAKTTNLKLASPSPNQNTLAAAVANAMGFKYTDIPHKTTAQVIASVLAGECDFTVNSLPGSIPYIDNGKFKVISALSPKRSPLQPNVPTAKEDGVDVGVNFNLGIWGPLGMPRDIVNKLNSAIAQSVKVPDIVEKFQGMAMIPTASTPEDLSKTYLSEIAFYTQAAKLVTGGK